MNKKEAIEEIENAIPDFILNDFQRGKETGLTYALDIVKQLDEPEKTVVPKFVAEWIESQKESFSDASAIHMYDNLTLDNNNGYYHEVWLWVIAHHHDFIKAWHDGYTVEQEKLYTVEIPNPNRVTEPIIYLSRGEEGKIFLNTWAVYVSQNWKNQPHTQLTEAEIRKDFDWAWQFAKEVKE